MGKSKEFRTIGISFGVLGKICINPWNNLIGEKLSLIHLLINMEDETIKNVYK